MRDLKSSLRSQIREKLKTISSAQRELDSSRARAILEQQPIWKEAQSILFFAPLADELDVWPSVSVALNARKHAFLPRFAPATKSYAACEIKVPGTDLRIGQFG